VSLLDIPSKYESDEYFKFVPLSGDTILYEHITDLECADNNTNTVLEYIVWVDGLEGIRVVFATSADAEHFKTQLLLKLSSLHG